MITFLIPVSAVPADDERFAEICRNNPESRVERTSKGDIIIMSPTGGETGRWNSLSADKKSSFPPLCPDFFLELRSKSDSLSVLQSKMTEWMENGCRLGWLIDMENKTCYIYRKNSETERILGESAVLSGENVLPDFTLNMADMYV